MHRPIPLILSLLLVLIAAGCAPDEAAQTHDDTAVPADTAAGSFTFRGDFTGPLGIQLWSVRAYTRDDVPGTLARVRAMGFREVELAGTYGMRPAQFRAALERAGLEASSMHVPYERLRDSLAVVLDEAETLGVAYVGLAWIPHPGDQPFTEAMARAAAADFNAWGQAARERGLQFFYHPHGYEFQPGPDGTTPFDVMVAETDPEAVKYEMDVFWVTHPGADPVALLRKYPDRWVLMHVKDMKQGTPRPDYSGQAPPDETEVPVGSGLIDYPAVLKAAQEIGLDRYYIEDETSAPFVSVPQSTAFMESVKF